MPDSSSQLMLTFLNGTNKTIYWPHPNQPYFLYSSNRSRNSSLITDALKRVHTLSIARFEKQALSVSPYLPSVKIEAPLLVCVLSPKA